MPFLFEIDELPTEVRTFALHSFIEKSKKIHAILVDRKKGINIHEVVNSKYYLNDIKQSCYLIQRCSNDLTYCTKIVKGNLCLFTLQGIYAPCMFDV